MTLERDDAAKSPEGDFDDDATLDAALSGLPVPELPVALREQLEAIPERGNVRRFPVRSWRTSVFGWAAAAAVGLFIGARSLDQESSEGASFETETLESASADDEDVTVALAVGSFAALEEEP